MTDYPPIYYKAKAVIQSCKTDKQISVAKRFLELSKPRLHIDSYWRLHETAERKLVAFKYAQACWATRDLIAVV